ncbi:hypothetical protein PVAP13_8KG206206 [Panicum virgatum]|uniref:Uncharacterized protein n=1 Tax=Panicum virgatum TaxID=38727 RepID=A0A8T0PMW2_PANVG|nr:hypothetical protein PVAP13_8KG206206 [Panicum virgatum]KAG2561582.1 hypothetical protein PVAP13_8KG206206 [Panicum virgatum]KAG2561583.1 hypothetical protein PVAP13_8KG206206 [Panicum virgatum]KAG2561584.1 hypothetical protein PVAP13_8KG206206 [Panicum virgatum]
MTRGSPIVTDSGISLRDRRVLSGFFSPTGAQQLGTQKSQLMSRPVRNPLLLNNPISSHLDLPTAAAAATTLRLAPAATSARPRRRSCPPPGGSARRPPRPHPPRVAASAPAPSPPPTAGGCEHSSALALTHRCVPPHACAHRRAAARVPAPSPPPTAAQGLLFVFAFAVPGLLPEGLQKTRARLQQDIAKCS